MPPPDNKNPGLSRRQFGALTLSATLGATLAAAGQALAATDPGVLPYLNPELSFKERVADLVGRLDRAEKAEQIQMLPNPGRLNIPSLCWWSESMHGIARADPATNFPAAIAMAASWNPALVQRVADAIASEARAMLRPYPQRYYGITLWAPTVNMARDPRWGRCQETYGEDPHLSGRIGVGYCKGLQGDDPKYFKTVATPKHFAVHSHETLRFQSNNVVSERTLREYYLPAFKVCFQEARAASTMTAHSGINGIPCTANGMLLTDILRADWGFEGAVTTDWNSVNYLITPYQYVKDPAHAASVALKAGVDVIAMEGSYAGNILNAISQGLCTDQDLDHAVTRNLTVRMQLGMFDPPVMVRFAQPKSIINCPAHVALARQLAAESIVLLQNNPVPPGFGLDRLLPIDLRKVRSIAVLGPYADAVLGGDYTPRPVNDAAAVTPLEGLQAAVGPRVKLVTADWGDMEEVLAAAAACDIALLFMGHSEGEACEGIDMPNIALPREAVLKRVIKVNPCIVLVVETCNSVGLEWTKANIPAALVAWYPGEQGGNAIADVLLGKVNPAGRLPMTFYRQVDDLPPLTDYEIARTEKSHGRTYWYHDVPVPYVFGHGISYTTFEYAKLTISGPTRTPAPASRPGGAPPHITPTDAPDAGIATVSVDVKNTGSIAGDEVVQVYVRKPDSKVKRPLKQLKAFQRLPIPAGEIRTVRLSFPVADLAYWDSDSHKFVVEPGPYEIQVGASSADIRLQGILKV